MTRWSRRIELLGGLFILFAGARTTYVLASGGGLVESLIDFGLTSFPGILIFYLGSWLPKSDLDPELYSRVLGWCLGGIAVMYAFIMLRVLHPGVQVEFTPGTRAIALALGSIGGIAIGLNEARAITRARKLEERNSELKQREQELERQNERLDKFTSIVAHDFRNPLSVAQGRLELAREEHDSDHLPVVSRAHKRMGSLIDDILLLGREDELAPEFEAVSLSEVAELGWQIVATDQAELRVETDRVIEADESRLRQLLENLVRNAVQHAGRDVTVTVGDIGESGFYLEDDGPGIPDELREDVFDYGFSSVDDGTGFGLAIVSRVADAHDWTVELAESGSGGARFEITGVEVVETEPPEVEVAEP